jgi:hypothetical protein
MIPASELPISLFGKTASKRLRWERRNVWYGFLVLDRFLASRKYESGYSRRMRTAFLSMQPEVSQQPLLFIPASSARICSTVS